MSATEIEKAPWDAAELASAEDGKPRSAQAAVPATTITVSATPTPKATSSAATAKPAGSTKKPTRQPRELQPFRPFPVDVLPDPIRGLVVAAAKAICCDTTYIVLPLLAILAAAIGNTRRIRIKRTWCEPAIAWTGIVGESGTAKSPAIELAMRPLQRAQHRAMIEYKSAIADYERKMLEYQSDLAAWKRKRGDKRGDPPPKPDEPVANRLFTSDCTIEALASLLESQPRGILVCRDELSAWIASFDRYAKGKGGGGGDAAKWLEMHGGRALIIDRKTGNRVTYIPRASVSLCGGIQPGVLRRSLTPEYFENGAAARLLLASPPRKPKVWTEADVSREIEAEVERVIEGLYALSPMVDEHGEQPVDVPLTPEAKALWITFFGEHAAEQVELVGDLAAAWSKLEGYAARLALIVHCVRLVAGDSSLKSLQAVDEASLDAGITMSRWFGGEAKRIYDMLSETAEEAQERQLAEWIDARGGKITARDLQRSGPSRYRKSAGVAKAALDALEEAGLGCWELAGATDQGGRPTYIFRVALRQNQDDSAEPVGSVACRIVATLETEMEEGEL